jgi:hypothetical protein
MNVPGLPRVTLLAAAILLGGCTAVPPPSPPAAAGLPALSVCDRLYCGREIPRGGEVSDDAWARFLTEVVTPRFPAGLTVLRGEGQWRGQSGAIARERSFILEIIHDDNATTEQAVQDIVTEYKRRFDQEAVLRMREYVTAKVL